jgi:cell division protein ZapA
MPELILEIGGRVFEVACQPGEDPSVERAGQLHDAETERIGDAGRPTEKRMLLLAGRMLAANALKLETEASHKTSPAEVAALREENEAAAFLLSQVLNEMNALADAAERR